MRDEDEFADTLATAGPAPELGPGTQVGRYVVLAELGRGGMGVVWRAYDAKLQREVALKLVTGTVSSTAHTRLVREARAMARLSHPHVVAVFDVEQTGHGLALAMELVRGTDLRTWLRERDADGEEILRMFLDAGAGLAAAHEAGMLHRDFKPGNVLVGVRADTQAWVVKVTDFGLAQLRGSPMAPHDDAEGVRSSTSYDDLTEAGTVMGTPRYMAPEQHLGAELTAAADQYAFCVALWEALAGEPPFLGSPSELARRKRKGPPPWPKSANVSPRIVDALRRGLSPQPAERWPSLRALLTVLAPRRSRRGRIVAVGTGLGVVGAIGAAVVLARPRIDPSERCRGGAPLLAEVWSPAQAAELEAALTATGAPYAAALADRTRARLDGWAAAWLREHRQACEATSVRREQSDAALDLRMRCLDRARRGFGARVTTLLSVDATTVPQVHEVLRELPAIDRCRRVEALSSEVPPPVDAEADAVAAVYERLDRALAVGGLGRIDAGLAEARAAEAAAVALRYAPLQARVDYVLGDLSTDAGDLQTGEAALSRALTQALATGQWALAFEATIGLMYTIGFKQQRPEAGLALVDAARGLHALAGADVSHAGQLHNAIGMMYTAAGDAYEAESQYRQAIAAWLQSPTEYEDGVLVARANLGAALRVQGKADEALALAEDTVAQSRAAFGPDHPHVLRAMQALGSAQLTKGQGADAARTYASALGGAGRTWGADHPDTAEMRCNYAAVLNALGRYDEAAEQSRAALGVLTKKLGPEHATTALARSSLATALVYAGEPEAAREHYLAALAIWSEQLGEDHPRVLSTRHDFGALLHDLGDDEAARAQLQLALDGMLALYGPGHNHVAAVRLAMANVTRELGDRETTRALLTEALESRTQSLDAGHPDLAAAQLAWGDFLVAEGRMQEALGPLQEAWETLRSRPSLQDHRASAAYLLAVALDATGGDPGRTLELARIAEEGFAAIGPRVEDSLARARVLRESLEP